MDKSSKKKPDVETEGGFNPDRPKQAPKKTVGPLPTDDPHGRAGQDLEAALKKQTQSHE